MKLVQNVSPLWNIDQVQKWVTLGQKLGHQAKSKENIVNRWRYIFEALNISLA